MTIVLLPRTGLVKRPVLIKSLGVEVTQKQKGRVVVRKVGGFEVRTQQFFYGRDLCRAVAPEGSPEELHHTALKKASI